MRKNTLKTLLTTTAIGCSVMMGCSSGVVMPRVDATNHISSALSIGSLLEVNGSYTTCARRSGSWSTGIGAFSALTNSPLSVIQDDTNCALKITSMRIGLTAADPLYSPVAPIPLGATLSGPIALSAAASPTALYLNSQITPDLLFGSDFVIEMFYSEDPSLAAPPAPKAATYVVAQSSVVAMSTLAPNYTLTLPTGFEIEANGSGVVESVSGTALLTAGTPVPVAGQDYAVTSTDLSVNNLIADVQTDFDNATFFGALTGPNPTVPASAFNLVGADLTTPGVKRNLIVRNLDNGVASYERFVVTFLN